MKKKKKKAKTKTKQKHNQTFYVTVLSFFWFSPLWFFFVNCWSAFHSLLCLLPLITVFSDETWSKKKSFSELMIYATFKAILYVLFVPQYLFIITFGTMKTIYIYISSPNDWRRETCSRELLPSFMSITVNILFYCSAFLYWALYRSRGLEALMTD